MTRINAGVPVFILCDQHLKGEHKEIPRVGSQLRRRMEREPPHPMDDIPPEFTLNKGHQTFFTDKGIWIKRRAEAVHAEMVKRGCVNAKCQWYPDNWEPYPQYMNDWQPTVPAFELMAERIQKMLPPKLTYYGEQMDHVSYMNMFWVRTDYIWGSAPRSVHA